MKIINKKAQFKYKLYDKFEAGIVLTGSEVKAVKKGRIDLTSSYAKIAENEIFLINTNISGQKDVSDPTRSRKLLLKKSEIFAIISKIKAKKLTLIPTKVYTKGRLVKIEIALAKSKKSFEKKEAIKLKDIKREIEQEIKGRNIRGR